MRRKETEQKLARYIIEENMNNGQRLPAERVLKGILGTSRNTLREVLHSFSSIGILELKPRSGYKLKSKELLGKFASGKDMKERCTDFIAFQQAVLPGMFSRLMEDISEEVIYSCEAILTKAATVTLENSREGLAESYKEFYLLLSSGTDNEFVEKFLVSTGCQFEEMIKASSPRKTDYSGFFSTFTSLVKAMKNKTERIEDPVCRHLDAIEMFLLPDRKDKGTEHPPGEVLGGVFNKHKHINGG
ncbi:GntR family transcriptional regulator [Limisalsivibrio acetivorans]|uniref:GntR family transcriptional regulator n=1 Tax=Limisalsivibrio acetivorans TaxID=1304888 RepID=UPI0003B61F54|nr:GntR family transcriptional regulator [Limisalsivibrio acetivorans]